MRVIGLTGGIAMGKSTVAAIFRRHRVPVFDADRLVHVLQGPGGAAVPAIARLFPDTVEGGAIQRDRLREAIARDPAALGALEQIIHPLVRAARSRFIARARARRAPLALLDIPLLFEGGGDRTCDLVVAVSAPPDLQRQRIRARRRMTLQQADAIIARQMADAERRARADIVIHTGLSRHHAVRQVSRLLRRLRTANIPAQGFIKKSSQRRMNSGQCPRRDGSPNSG